MYVIMELLCLYVCCHGNRACCHEVFVVVWLSWRLMPEHSSLHGNIGTSQLHGRILAPNTLYIVYMFMYICKNVSLMSSYGVS